MRLLNDRPAIKFHDHKDGISCETCQFIEEHKNSLRGHYDYYCRCLPVPAKIAYELTDYWCGQYKEKE